MNVKQIISRVNFELWPHGGEVLGCTWSIDRLQDAIALCDGHFYNARVKRMFGTRMCGIAFCTQAAVTANVGRVEIYTAQSDTHTVHGRIYRVVHIVFADTQGETKVSVVALKQLYRNMAAAERAAKYHALGLTGDNCPIKTLK